MYSTYKLNLLVRQFITYQLVKMRDHSDIHVTSMFSDISDMGKLLFVYVVKL